MGPLPLTAAEKLDAIQQEISAGIQNPAAYTIRQRVADWLDSLELDPSTVKGYRGPAKKWVYPAIGATKLKDFNAIDADRFFRDAAQAYSKASLVKIKSTLTRSIRRAQKYDLIGWNVAELADLPEGRLILRGGVPGQIGVQVFEIAECPPGPARQACGSTRVRVACSGRARGAAPPAQLLRNASACSAGDSAGAVNVIRVWPGLPVRSIAS
jgi:hypothetical protein